jgi:hypothetical protein
MTRNRSPSDDALHGTRGGEWHVVTGSDVAAFDSTPSASLSAEASQFDPAWYADGSAYEVTLYSTDGEQWYSLEGEELVAWEPVQVIDDPTLWSPSASLSDFGSYGEPTTGSGS